MAIINHILGNHFPADVYGSTAASIDTRSRQVSNTGLNISVIPSVIRRPALQLNQTAPINNPNTRSK